MRIDVRSLRDLDDEVLVDRSRGRDRAAFEELVRRYADRLYAVVLRLCTDAHEAEEVTQEAFLRAWRGIGSAGTEATSICSCRRSSSRGTSSSPTTREAPGAAMRWPTARWSGRGAIRSVESARPSRRRRGAGVLRPGVRAGLSGGLLVVLGGGTVQLLDRSPAAPGRRRVSCPTSSIAASSSARSASERSPCARRSCHDVALTARTEGAARSAQRAAVDSRLRPRSRGSLSVQAASPRAASATTATPDGRSRRFHRAFDPRRGREDSPCRGPARRVSSSATRIASLRATPATSVRIVRPSAPRSSTSNRHGAAVRRTTG